MQDITYSEYIKNFNLYLQKPATTIVAVSSDEDVCVLASKSSYNEQYCIDNNINVYHTGHRGGIIINFKEDISIGIINSSIGVDYIINEILKNFKMRGFNCSYEDNDILVDGYKVIGFSQRIIDNVVSIAFHVSIGMDLDLIRNICIKPMNKIPKGLSDYGITKQDIKDIISSIMEGL